MIPARFAHVVFGLILTGVMTFIVSGIATVRVLDAATPLMGAWLSAWIYSWAVAFPTVLVVAPLTRRIVARIVAQ